ncbi:hypothetical protein ACQ859_16600 [Roseateles chitinivorans]|uniref:hypothetical protein n=1 Tax=Roseateles chitinivorans TaxID=2917965 RepID=UPI003D664260
MSQMVSFTTRIARPFGDVPIAATVRVWADDSASLRWEADLLGVAASRAAGTGTRSEGESLHAAGVRLLQEWVESLA